MWIYSIYTCVNTCNVFGTAKVLQNQFCRITLELTWAHVLLRLKQQRGWNVLQQTRGERPTGCWWKVVPLLIVKSSDKHKGGLNNECSGVHRGEHVPVLHCCKQLFIKGSSLSAWSLTHQCASQQLFSQRLHKMWGWCTGLLDINTLSSCALSGLISCHMITTPGYLVHPAEFKSNRKPDRVQFRSLKCHRCFLGG